MAPLHRCACAARRIAAALRAVARAPARLVFAAAAEARVYWALGRLRADRRRIRRGDGPPPELRRALRSRQHRPYVPVRLRIGGARVTAVVARCGVPATPSPTMERECWRALQAVYRDITGQGAVGEVTYRRPVMPPAVPVLYQRLGGRTVVAIDAGMRRDEARAAVAAARAGRRTGRAALVGLTLTPVVLAARAKTAAVLHPAVTVVSVVAVSGGMTAAVLTTPTDDARRSVSPPASPTRDTDPSAGRSPSHTQSTPRTPSPSETTPGETVATPSPAPRVSPTGGLGAGRTVGPSAAPPASSPTTPPPPTPSMTSSPSLDPTEETAAPEPTVTPTTPDVTGTPPAPPPTATAGPDEGFLGWFGIFD